MQTCNLEQKNASTVVQECGVHPSVPVMHVVFGVALVQREPCVPPHAGTYKTVLHVVTTGDNNKQQGRICIYIYICVFVFAGASCKRSYYPGNRHVLYAWYLGILKYENAFSNIPQHAQTTHIICSDSHQYLKFNSCWSCGGSVVRAFAPWAGGRGFDPRPRHTKDVIKMVPNASLLSAQHIRTGLVSLSSQTLLKKRWIPSGMSGREWLI